MSTITRAERLTQIKQLQAEGNNYREIALLLGLTASGVRNIINDPDGSKQRARRKRYQGVCIDCGGPTDGANGREKAPLRCLYCVKGVASPHRAPDRRRILPVRLTNIPLDVRLVAAREANRIEKGEPERREILFAAIFPSNTVYWVAPSSDDLWQAAA